METKIPSKTVKPKVLCNRYSEARKAHGKSEAVHAVENVKPEFLQNIWSRRSYRKWEAGDPAGKQEIIYQHQYVQPGILYKISSRGCCAKYEPGDTVQTLNGAGDPIHNLKPEIPTVNKKWSRNSSRTSEAGDQRIHWKCGAGDPVQWDDEGGNPLHNLKPEIWSRRSHTRYMV